MTAYCGNSLVLDAVLTADTLGDTPIDDANVTVTIRDVDGIEVSGAMWPLAMAHISAGLYRALLPAGLDFVPKQSYVAYIDADGGFNRTGHWELSFRPEDRSVKDDA